LLDELERAAATLTDESTTTNQHEEAVRIIGAALGFSATRPDANVGTGPDVLWLSEDEGLAYVFELKTDKDGTRYRKKEVGQIHQHIQWVRDHHPEVEQIPLVVGPRRGCTDDASPPPGVEVVSAEELSRVAGDLRSLYGWVMAHGGDLFTAAMINDGLGEFSLRHADLADQLETGEMSAFSVR
jgi:hypothetical protein